MVFFIYNYVSSDTPPAPPPPTPEHVNTENPSPQNDEEIPENTESPSVTTTPEPTTSPVSMTKAVTTPPPLSDPSSAYVPGTYDESFFANDLFIGDSIMTGIYLYGFIPAENVYAKVGINPSSASDTEINGLTALSKATQMKPARIYVMLGSNGISFLSGSDMVTHMEGFMEELAKAAPNSQIILLTIPPVTAEYEQSHPETIQNVNDYNYMLKTSALRNNYFIIDSAATLKDSEGYLAAEYAEADGLHFKSSAYKAMLSLIQYTVQNS
ncbi:MAG: GDSL-type esterase/lipase family protein [Oscillospiraceae bacterium]|nr:GDSL-type esterase/lipase family protein [Oscillospiraceae bacterium]